MGNERDDDQFDKSSDREPGSKQGQQNEFGQQRQKDQSGGLDSEQSLSGGQGQQGGQGSQQFGSQQGGQSPSGGQSATGQAEGGASNETLTGERGLGKSDPGGTEPGFVGSEGEESGEYLQEKDPQQAGFAEQGRGAPDEGRDIERGGERSANFDSDIEGSSENR